ncbi:MAG: glycosyltransferase [Williamsia sp.]|nr:glycosyltransferase [Williamsia sp.]
MRNLVIGIYFHPEAFPPTLNAVSELSECFDQITIVHRPHLHNTWKYPANVRALASGSFMTAKQQEAASVGSKAGFYIRYVYLFLKQCIREKPEVILVYDSISLYAYHMIKRLLRFKHKVWYHNHDVVELPLLRRFSIGWFAARKEAGAFDYLDMFSLPTNERLAHFPMQRFKGHYFFIPNYPAKKFYLQFYRRRTLQQTVRLIFQGHIGPYHGIEETIPLLKESIMGHQLELVLKGPCQEDYRERILQQAMAYNVTGSITFIGITPYADVPATTSTCHIGIGILAKKDIMNTTLGTASNKLYEYAAVGLPVLYYNSENFTRHLGKYTWAFPVDTTSDDIKEKLTSVLQSYDQLSAAAHYDFLHGLNFEAGFKQVKAYLIQERKDHI